MMFTRTMATTADRRLLRPISPFTPHPSAVRASRLPNKRSCVSTSTEERQRPQRSGKSFFLVRERSRTQLQCTPPAPYPLTPSPHAPRGYQTNGRASARLPRSASDPSEAANESPCPFLSSPGFSQYHLPAAPRGYQLSCFSTPSGEQNEFQAKRPLEGQPAPHPSPCPCSFAPPFAPRCHDPTRFCSRSFFACKIFIFILLHKKRIRFRNPFSLRRLLW